MKKPFRTRITLLLLPLLLLLAPSAYGQIRWINGLEKGLAEARDRDAPIVALLWDYD